MIVQVTKDVRIRAEDGNNYAVEQRHVSKSGKTAGNETWKSIGYYGSLQGAANSLVTRHLALLVNQRTGKVSTKLQLKLNHVVEMIDAVGADIIAAIRNRDDEEAA